MFPMALNIPTSSQDHVTWISDYWNLGEWIRIVCRAGIFAASAVHTNILSFEPVIIKVFVSKNVPITAKFIQYSKLLLIYGELLWESFIIQNPVILYHLMSYSEIFEYVSSCTMHFVRISNIQWNDGELVQKFTHIVKRK